MPEESKPQQTQDQSSTSANADTQTASAGQTTDTSQTSAEQTSGQETKAGAAKTEEFAPDPLMQIILEDLGRPQKQKDIKAADDKETKQESQNEDDTKESKTSSEDKTETSASTPKTSQPKTEAGQQQEAKSPKVSKKADVSQLVEDAVKRAMDSKSQQQQQTKQPTREPEKKPDTNGAPDLSGWLPEEVEEYELATFAAKAMPERYKDLPSKVAKFKSEVEAYISKQSSEDPDRTFDENDTAFMEFVEEHKPEFPDADRKKAQRLQIAEEIKKDLKKETEEETERLKNKVKAVEKEPRIRKLVGNFAETLPKKMSDAPDNILPEELKDAKEIVSGIADKITEEGPESVKGNIFGDIVSGIHRLAIDAAHRFTVLAEDADKFDPKNEMDMWLGNFITKQESDFATRGGEMLNRVSEDGRKLAFVPRHEFARMVVEEPAKAAQHWCFNDDEIREMLALTARNLSLVQVGQMYKKMKASGWEMPKAKPQPKPGEPKTGNQKTQKEEKDQKKSPTVVPAAIPAAGAKTGADGRQPTWDMLDDLGIPKITRP